MAGDNKPTRSEEDIDLLLLAERSLLFFKRYRWVFIIAIVAGLAAGYYFYTKIVRTYKSQLLVHSFFLTNQEEIQIVSTWNELLAKKEHAALAQILNTDQRIFSKVKKIKASEVQQVFSQENPHGFIIDALVTDNEVLDELQTAIVYGFENNVYVKGRLALKKQGLEELIRKTEIEILKLDSTRKIFENIIAGRERISSSLIIDGSSLNMQLIELNEKLITLKESLRYANAIQVLQDFPKFKRPAGPKLFPWLIIGLVAALGLAYVYALFNSVRTGLRDRERLRRNATAN